MKLRRRQDSFKDDTKLNSINTHFLLIKKLISPEELEKFIRTPWYVYSLGLSAQEKKEIYRPVRPLFDDYEFEDAIQEPCVMKIVEAQPVAFVHTIADDSYRRYCMNVSLDGKKVIASLHHSNKMGVWDTRNAKLLFSLNDAQYGVVALSPDGKKCAVGIYRTNAIELWDIEKHERLAVLKSHTTPRGANGITALAWNYNQTFVACAEYGNMVHIWNVATGTVIKSLALDATVTLLSWNPQNTNELALASGTKLILWNVHTGDQRIIEDNTIDDHIESIAWNPQGTMLAMGAGFFRHDLHIFDIQKNMFCWHYYDSDGKSGSSNFLAWNHKGTKFARVLKNGKIEIFTTKSRARRNVLSSAETKKYPQAIGWSHDGKTLISFGTKGNIYHWQIDPLNRLNLEQALLLNMVEHKQGNGHIELIKKHEHLARIYNSLPTSFKKAVDPGNTIPSHIIHTLISRCGVSWHPPDIKEASDDKRETRIPKLESAQLGRILKTTEWRAILNRILLAELITIGALLLLEFTTSYPLTDLFGSKSH